MEPVRPAPSVHHAAGELVDDDDLAALDDIVDVAAEHLVGPQRLVDVVDDGGVLEIVEIAALEQPCILQQALHPLGAVLGEHDRALLLVMRVIVLVELLHQRIDGDVELGLVVRGARDDQWRARLVDQDRVHLIDDRIIERALDHLSALIFHVVAQIVEAELVVGRVGDVGLIGRAALVLAQIGHDDAGGEPQEAIDLTHPLAVAAGEIVVHGDDVDALAFQRVEIGRQRGDERLALARAHLGDFAAVEHDATDHLHVVMALADGPLGRLAHGGEGFGQQIVELGAVREALAELAGLVLQFLVAHRRNGRFEPRDMLHGLAEGLDVTVVGRPEDGFGEGAEHGWNPVFWDEVVVAGMAAGNRAPASGRRAQSRGFQLS